MENQAKNLSEHLARRILVLDGATGTLIQSLGLQQKDFVFQGRGPMRGLNDLLCLTRPDAVEDIHRRYLEAGADIISTNTFNANEISLEEYAAADLSDAINAAAVALARRAADAYATPERPRWVAGILGPTGRTASLSPDVADPSVRNITFDRLFEAYSRQARTLAEGGADLLMVETVFDSLNAKAAVAALREEGVDRTVMLTGDAKAVGEAVAADLGLDEVHTQLLPGGKVDRVEELLAQKSPKGALAFVGDGINDAPVLSRADVGIAMGALGSDAAIEAADVVLMDDKPSKIAVAIGIARKTLRIVRQNIVFALAVKALVLILGAAGLANMWEAVFADVGVSVIAILNAMRALKA